jgi:hypothetical protein
MPFERVGRVLGVGVVELEEHVLGVADQRRNAARAQAQQAKHRQVLGMDREQDVAMEDEGDADVARRLAVVDQEVGADVQLAVVFLVEAGRFLEVVVDGVARDRQAEVLGDPALFLVGRRVEVDPHRRTSASARWLSISSWKSRPLASVKTFSMKAPAS